jgi:hypothetical protein
MLFNPPVFFLSAGASCGFGGSYSAGLSRLPAIEEVKERKRGSGPSELN